MLVIRNQQIEELRAASLAALRGRLRCQLRAEPAASSLNERQMDALIARVLADARRFRLPREAHLLRFAKSVSVFCGPDVARELPVQALQILLSYGTDPALKLDRFDSWATTSVNAPCELDL